MNRSMNLKSNKVQKPVKAQKAQKKTAAKKSVKSPLKTQRRLFSADPFAAGTPPPAAPQQTFRKNSNAPMNPFQQKKQFSPQNTSFNPTVGNSAITPNGQGDPEDVSMTELSEIQDSSSSEEPSSENDLRRFGLPYFKPIRTPTDNDEGILDESPHTVAALSQGMEPPPLPKQTHYKRPKNGIYDPSGSDSEINTDNAPDYPQRIKPRSRSEITKTKDGFKWDSEVDGHPLWSDQNELSTDGGLSGLDNELSQPESPLNLSDFEDLGTLGLLLGPETNYQQLRDLVTIDENQKFRPGPTKLRLPRLKKGRPVPNGFMINEAGFCVPRTPETAHHKYADPDLYVTPLHDRLANLVESKLPKALKFNGNDREAMLEVTSTGQHFYYDRNREKVLQNPLIDEVIAKVNARRGDPKIMDFEENIDLSFKTQNLNPYNRYYRYKMTAQGHALMDIDPKMLLQVRNRKQRSPHRVPGPSMDWSFMSTGWHKATH
jgi:hypothetical protein